MNDARPVLAVLGGSFNPPHLGHAMLPGYLLARGDAARVLVAPCADHPLGKSLTPFARRMAWVRAAMAHYGERVEVSGIEAELAVKSGGRPSYTIELLEALAVRRPEHRVRLVVGSDIIESGETDRWHRWDAIGARFDPIVVPRAGWSSAGAAALPEVSSTEVRADLDALRAGSLSPEQARERLAARVPGAVVEALLRWIAGEERRVWVVGHGHVAAHMVPHLRGRGLIVEQFGARAQIEAGELNAGERAVPSEAPMGVYLLAQDGGLGALAEALAGRLPAGVPVVHAAGALCAREVLAPLARVGHPVGTLHPICSMRSELERSRVASASFGVEGLDDPAIAGLVRAMIGEAPVLDIGALDGRGRLAYHAACALVANHMAVLHQRAAVVLASQGHPREHAERALGDLMLGSLDNLLGLGVPAGITGPLSRGDRATVAAHLAALDDPATESLYRDLSTRLAALLEHQL